MDNKKYIRLGLSENHHFFSEKIASEIEKEIPSINLYPDTECLELRKIISQCINISKKQIYVGNGLDEVILSIFLGLNIIHKKVVISEHTFMGYFHSASLLENEIIEVPNKKQSIDIDSVIDIIKTTKVDLVFLCNPHNPLGTVIMKGKICELAKLCVEHNTYLAIDEAYIEFLEHVEKVDVTQEVNAYNKLIVLRTFSKAYGLAGLRCGYACAHIDTISKMQDVKKVLPFSVNRIVQKAVACAILDKARLENIKKINIKNLEWTKQELEKLNVIYTDSYTNFISLYYKDAEIVIEFLKTNYHILVKDLSSMGMENWLRISIGTKEQMEQFIIAIKECMHKYGYGK